MARVWTCECGWTRKNGKEVWFKDPKCPGKHREEENQAHGLKVPAKFTGNKPKHNKEPKHRKDKK